MTTAALAKFFPLLRGELMNNVGPEASDWPTRARGIHLVPGIVKYEAVLNDDGTEKTPAITYLLTQEAIDRGRPTASGLPIVGRSGGYDHIPGIKAEDTIDGKFDGDIWESKSEDGKEWLYFLIKDPETKKACADGFKLSCAYFPTETDDTPGKFAGVDYDSVIKDLRYTHVAIVPNPRYDFSLTGAEGSDEGRIELLNSIKGGGLLNEPLKKVLVGLIGVKTLREITNAAEIDEKATAKEKAKSAFDEEMKNAADDDSKKKALEKYNAAIAAADMPGAADKATKDAAAHAERQNRVKMLRNAADSLEAAYGGDKSKGMEHRNEADRLEKIPLGGGDVTPDPGVAPNPGTGGTAAATGPLLTDEAAKKDLEAKNAAEEVSRLAKEKEEKEENKNAGEAWNSFTPDMVDEGAAVKVALIGGRIAPFASQLPEVQNAWKAAVKAAPGATLVERCNSLKAKAANVVVKREADAAVEKSKQERFNSLREAAARRGGATTIPALGMHSDQDAADLGAALYG